MAQRILFTLGRAEGRSFLELPTESPWRLLASPLRWMAGIGPRDSLAYSLTHPFPPQPWFESEVAEAVAGIAEQLAMLVDDGLGGLEDVNLDTGDPESEDRPYPPTVEARNALAKRLGSLALP